VGEVAGERLFAGGLRAVLVPLGKVEYSQTTSSKIKIMLKVKIVNRSPFDLPQYATPFSAGMDLRANITEPVLLASLQRVLVPTGLFIELPEGYEAQIRPRSGLAAKHGLSIVNAPGTIDADYRGEIKVILVNLSDTVFALQPGERIAQMVVAQHAQVCWEAVSELADSTRGGGGFGSTGVQ
jgi:dUTP pyrophosphatase